MKTMYWETGILSAQIIQFIMQQPAETAMVDWISVAVHERFMMVQYQLFSLDKLM